MEDLKAARDLIKTLPPLDKIDAAAILERAKQPFVLGAYDFFFVLGASERLRADYAAAHAGRSSYPGFQGACCIPAIWIAGGHDLRSFAEKGYGAVVLKGLRGISALKAIEDVVRKELQHEIGLARGETMGVHYVLEAVDIIGELTKMGPTFIQQALRIASQWRVLAQRFLAICENFLRHRAQRGVLRGSFTPEQIAALDRQAKETVALVDFVGNPQVFRKPTVFAPFLEGRPFVEEEIEKLRRAVEQELDPYFHLRYGRLDYQGLFKEGYAE